MMPTENPLTHRLIDARDSVLVVIDVQDYFLDKLTATTAAAVANRVGWIMEVASILEVPMIVTAEDMENLGGLPSSLTDRLPPGTRVHNKMVFGLAGEPEIMDTLHATERKTAVLVGLETDVCIAHSAIGLIAAGFQVVALADATSSPGEGHASGLERMRGAGVLITTVKGLYYEWVRTVARADEMAQKHLDRIGTPTGITL